MEFKPDVKARIIDCMQRSSAEIALRGIKKRAVDKFKEVEPDLLTELDINHLFDYLQHNDELKDFFISKGINENESDILTNAIIQQLSAYKDALLKLGIIL